MTYSNTLADFPDSVQIRLNKKAKGEFALALALNASFELMSRDELFSSDAAFYEARCTQDYRILYEATLMCNKRKYHPAVISYTKK
jgi:hypothetical protein